MAGAAERSSLDHRASRVARSIARAALAVLLALAAAPPARASDTGLSGRERHPRERFPLAVWAERFDDPELDGAVRRAIADWNALFRAVVGVPAFAPAATRQAAQVTVAVQPPGSGKLMGFTELGADAQGVIALPVRVVVVAPVARGQTSRATLLYQVVAHELGHALGLPHVRDPRSIMCCVPGSVDFGDPATREAYVDARRHPDIRSARAEVAEHYASAGRGQ